MHDYVQYSNQPGSQNLGRFVGRDTKLEAREGRKAGMVLLIDADLTQSSLDKTILQWPWTMGIEPASSSL